MVWTQYLSLAGLLIGAGMGLYAMIDPRWAARLVRLRDDPDRPGGFAEFRGTYGGLFLGSHGVALFLMAAITFGPPAAAGTLTGLYYPAAMGAALACAAMWLGTSVGRLLSIALDKTGGGFNTASVIFEIVLGLLIAAPLLGVLLAG